MVSACLAGSRTRYDGSSQERAAVERLVKEGKAIPVCPEQLGGLPTPRSPAEIEGDGGASVLDGAARVVDREGADLTRAFLRGARESLKLARLFGATVAVMKSKSPSCGCGTIYDGSFSGSLVKGDGVLTALLKREGIVVVNEDQAESL